MGYFSCTSHSSRCKAEFRKCSDGKSPDNEICASVAENPQNYLVPHPTDCTKFFSCQSLGHNRGWIAHLMDCPATTGFDTKLRICNYIKSLPRCNNEESVGRLVLQHQFDHVRPAKQTRTNFRIPSVILDVPKVGYLKNSGVLAVDTFGPEPSTPSTSQVVRQKRNTTHTGHPESELWKLALPLNAAPPQNSGAQAPTYKLYYYLTGHVILLATTMNAFFQL